MRLVVADELRQNLENGIFFDVDRNRLNNLAFGITGIGSYTQLEFSLVSFIGIKQIRGKLGCLAEAER